MDEIYTSLNTLWLCADDYHQPSGWVWFIVIDQVLHKSYNDSRHVSKKNTVEPGLDRLLLNYLKNKQKQNKNFQTNIQNSACSYLEMPCFCGLLLPSKQRDEVWPLVGLPTLLSRGFHGNQQDEYVRLKCHEIKRETRNVGWIFSTILIIHIYPCR